MRFVFAITRLGPNGPSGSRIRYAEGLVRRGHDVSIVSFSPPHNRQVPAGISHPIIESVVRGDRRDIVGRAVLAHSFRRWFRTETAQEPVDFLSSSLTRTDTILYASGVRDSYSWIHIATSKLLDDARTLRIRERRRRMYRKLYDGRTIVGVSKGVIDDLALLGACPSRAALIYNAYDAADLRGKASEPAQIPDGPFVLHVGRFAEPKRHDILFEAFRRVPEPYKLVLLTPASEKLTKLIAHFGLQSRVVVAGFQQNPYAFMARAAALVLSSDREGFPNVIAESLICGTPVVSTDCAAGPSEILTGEYARWLSPPGDAVRLADNLLAVLQRPYDIPSSLIERFSLDHALDRLEALAAAGPRPSLGPMRFIA